jgi:hypothetical protein
VRHGEDGYSYRQTEEALLVSLGAMEGSRSSAYRRLQEQIEIACATNLPSEQAVRGAIETLFELLVERSESRRWSLDERLSL